jgi:hypothetical protein
VLVLAIGVVVLFGAAIAAVLIAASMRRRSAATRETTRNELQELLKATLPDSYRRYLEHSNPSITAEPEEVTGEPVYLTRLRHIVLTPPTSGAPHVGSDTATLGLAILEVRMNNLVKDLERIERNAVGEDRVLRTILTLLGIVVGMLAGIVGIVAGIVSLA